MADRLLQQQNFFENTLSQDIENDDVKIYMNTLPLNTEGYLVISQDDASKREIIYYTSLGTNYVLCPATGGRGIGGTTAQSHDATESVTLDVVAEYHNPVIKALANYRNRAEISFSRITDDISVAIGTVIVNSSVCINASSITMSDIGIAGTNKIGSVSSGGIRYIYAQDNGDSTFSLYVSNNSSEVGKRRLGFAKFNEGSTEVIRYVYNDDDSSPFASGMIIGWTGPITDVPQGWEYDTAAAGRFEICANATYTIGTTGGAALYNFAHTHVVSTVSTEHTHTISHTHTYSGTTSDYSLGGVTHPARSLQDVNETSRTHTHTFSGTTSASAANSGNMSDNASHSHTTASMLSDSTTIMPPFIARTKIVKI